MLLLNLERTSLKCRTMEMVLEISGPIGRRLGKEQEG